MIFIQETLTLIVLLFSRLVLRLTLLMISTTLVNQWSRSFTLARAEGLMECDIQTWMLNKMDTLSCDNFRHLLLQLDIVWEYWVVGEFSHRPSL